MLQGFFEHHGKDATRMDAIRRSLIALVAVALLTPLAFGQDLASAYGDILRGEYESGRQIIDRLKSSGKDSADLSRAEGWLEHFSKVVSKRREVNSETFQWNVEQSQKALQAGEPYLALTFAARGIPYAEVEDPFIDADWTDALVESAMREAEKLARENEWSKAAAYYALIDRIRPDQSEIEDQLDNATRHARLEMLYDDEEELERRIDGANYQLLRSVVRVIDQTYYEEPDFKVMALGAIDNLITLCETSKLYEFLDGVGNPATRSYFESKLRDLRKHVEKQDEYDYLDFLRLYKRDVVEANRKSIELPDGLLVVEFLEGALAKLDDFTSVVWPVDATDFDKVMMGGFEGVGIQLGRDEYTKRLRVVTPLEDSPAIEAGIQAGDLIVEVDGESTKGWTTDDAVRNIMGEAGTKVILTMFRPSTGQRIPFTLTRRSITLKTVRGVERLDEGRSQKWNFMLDSDSGIAYIRLTQFLGDSAKELREAVQAAQQQGMKGLIFDLRGNPGGYLHSAIEIVSLFVDRGEVVSTNGLAEQPEHHRVTGRAPFADLPMVVLVNKGSASASEIFAGAMQDHHRALVLGERTFGKGSVQRVLPLGLDARLKLTTALYYLPSGRSPHRRPDAEVWGVEPNWELALNPKEYSQVLKHEYDSYIIRATDDVNSKDEQAKDADEKAGSALDALAEDDKESDDDTLLSEDDIAALEADPVEVGDFDPQLETALLHLRVKLAGHLPWPKDIVARTVSIDPRD
jgi:carboxyl-terminal processing protease